VEADSARGDDQPWDGAPAETTCATTLDIEFEIVSFVRPRSLGLSEDTGAVPTTGAGAAARHHVVSPDDDAVLDIILWAYYEACRRGTGANRELPWASADADWRSFAAALRSDPDRVWWWADPAERLAKAQAAFASLNAPGAPLSRSAAAPLPASRQAPRQEVDGAMVYVTPEGATVTVRHAPAPRLAPASTVRARSAPWGWDLGPGRLRGGP
jgi:hypothetical protein